MAIDYVYLDPRVFINPGAKAAILDADLVVLGSGDLFTSVIPPLLVDGMVEALRETTAKRIYVVNLMTKPGESTGYHVTDFVETMREYLGGAPLDGIIVNNGIPSERVRTRYTSQGQELVTAEGGDLRSESRVVYRDLVTSGMLVRHDPDRLAATLLSLWRELISGSEGEQAAINFAS